MSKGEDAVAAALGVFLMLKWLRIYRLYVVISGARSFGLYNYTI